mmetsp:Transcript_85113/g.241440  ORF Transcript_85113/g.241440 Transcript_85113/m.241440 type:complete len:206 (-) Transcript_85113:85-702(-)
MFATVSSIIRSSASSVSSRAFFSARIASCSRVISSEARLTILSSIVSRLWVSSRRLSYSFGMSTSTYLRRAASASTRVRPSRAISSRSVAVFSSKERSTFASASRRACCSTSSACWSRWSMAAISLVFPSCSASRLKRSSSKSRWNFASCSFSCEQSCCRPSCVDWRRRSTSHSVWLSWSKRVFRSCSRPCCSPDKRSESRLIRS